MARHHAGRPQGGKIVTDPAALLHGQRPFLQGVEDTVHRVLDGPHDEAVEQRDVAATARPGQDAAARQKTEIFQDVVETLFPRMDIVALLARQKQRNAAPGVDHRLVALRRTIV